MNNLYITTSLFWDCECEEDYIHLRNWYSKCNYCGALQADSPDSRTDECADLLRDLYRQLSNERNVNDEPLTWAPAYRNFNITP